MFWYCKTFILTLVKSCTLELTQEWNHILMLMWDQVGFVMIFIRCWVLYYERHNDHHFARIVCLSLFPWVLIYLLYTCVIRDSVWKLQHLLKLFSVFPTIGSTPIVLGLCYLMSKLLVFLGVLLLELGVLGITSSDIEEFVLATQCILNNFLEGRIFFSFLLTDVQYSYPVCYI